MDSRKTNRINRIVTVLFFLYVTVLLRITVFRSDFSLNGLCQNGTLNLTLFQGYMPFIKQKDWFDFTYLFLGNIIWFVPFGMYLQYRGKVKRSWYGLFYGLLFSLVIETLQYVFGTGLSELDDLVLNSFGAWIGVWSVCGIRYLFARRREK